MVALTLGKHVRNNGGAPLPFRPARLHRWRSNKPNDSRWLRAVRTGSRRNSHLTHICPVIDEILRDAGECPLGKPELETCRRRLIDIE